LKKQVSPKDFYLRNTEGHLKRFPAKLETFFMISDGKIPPGTNQIAIKEARKGFFGCYSVCETMKDTKEG